MNTLSNKNVKTRKAHTCWGCAREFPKGTLMQRIVKDEYGLCAYYWCRTCQEVIRQTGTILYETANKGELKTTHKKLRRDYKMSKSEIMKQLEKGFLDISEIKDWIEKTSQRMQAKSAQLEAARYACDWEGVIDIAADIWEDWD